ncbi:D-alanyl-D-alanine carboxypeptidase/D-alanyl-D-alanine endopeptidase [Prosthecobacter dejongeii]|uniref:D-alanyl-D-alanine carboxypeptidase/D-alanyl-D-alanine-endopeptidase (Penicillin-binding protein 4) n=1 Tax=Prosthecobacter dejongeii TaxID=48465 RepID=A0A7W8DNT6_9BACT|nr:D-alanyl-D-alanine carboxypeptidase/D-alanyl-D-alanine-endopeptidase (penicillin-binding protein 4) [Prosthecobacter dejongeii]
MKNAFLCLLLAALAALLVLHFRDDRESHAPPATALGQIFQQVFEEPGMKGAAIGFCLLDAQGQVIEELNSQTAFIPASTLKTLTTATALEKWGPDHRLETTVITTAPIQEGRLTGDVIIRGGGDPMLSLNDLEGWVLTLLQKGVKRIQGRIIGDGSLFPGSIYDDFWNWGDIGNGYGSGVSGLNLEHNRSLIRIRPGEEVGAKAMFLVANPQVPNVQWVNEATTGAANSGDGVVIHGGERTGVLHLRGTVPLSAGNFEVTAAVPDPELYAAHHLRVLLVDAGIEVDGEAASASELRNAGGSVPEASEILIKHASPTLREIVTSIHATSDNHETECLYRLLGVREGKSSDEVLRAHWQSRGLVFEGLRMEDGCGLARADFIRPLDLARLQHVAGTGPQGAVYRESLLATEDGSVRWKGGAMSGVRSYTGYVKSASGGEFCFALMVNHFADAQAVARLREAVLGALKTR